jgi:AraC-like DNA-binding protein
MLPNVRTLHIRTDDADEARERLAREFGGHSRVPDARGPLGYELFAVGTRGVTAGSTTARLGSTLRAATTGPTLHLPLSSTGRYRVGRRKLEAGNGVAVLLAAGHEYTARLAAGSWLALRIDTTLLSNALDAGGNRPSRAWAFDSVEVQLSAGGVAFVRETIARLRELEAAADRLAKDAIETVECRATYWLADRLQEAQGVGPVPRDSVTVAENIDRWIREHALVPITLEDLARIAGVSARVLQKACNARWGRSPLELVASHRMAAARQRILTAPSTITVTQVAIESGFSHFGRFATAYRQAYGESPSETVASRAAAWSDAAGRRQAGPCQRHDRSAAAPIRDVAHERALAP